MENNKIVITGSLGFIGSSVLNHFIVKDYDVLGLDVISSDAHTKKIDLLNQEELRKILKEFSPNLIIHCAGSANVNESIKDPKKDYRNNVLVTKNLIDSVLYAKLKTRIVFMSSAAVYGNQSVLPINEEAPLNPLSPYAEDKIICEDMFKNIKSNEVDIKIVRAFSVYGPGLKKQIFWDMHKKLQETGKLEMFGTGEESRDYIYISDLVNAIELIATKKSQYSIFNVANGKEIPIKDVVKIFAECNNTDKYYFNNVHMEGSPNRWEADISRLSKIGFKKTVDIEKGIKKYCDWVKNL